jgi:hypothetical protein
MAHKHTCRQTHTQNKMNKSKQKFLKINQDSLVFPKKKKKKNEAGSYCSWKNTANYVPS